MGDITSMRDYLVYVTPKHPVANERVTTIEVSAKNAREACKKARAEIFNRGYTRQDGVMFYRAAEVKYIPMWG